MNIKTVKNLTPEESAALFGWGEDIFEGRQYGLIWHKGDQHYVGSVDEKAVSHAGVVFQDVNVGAQSIRVAGIGGVVTVPEAQSKGLATQLLKIAMEDLKKSDIPFGLLFCADKRLTWYGSLGWKKIEANVTVQQPQRECRMPLHAMIYRFGSQDWPTGNIHLNSLPW